MEEKKRVSAKKNLLGILLLLFLVGFFFVAHILEYGPVKIIRYCVLAAALFYLSMVDMEKKIIPNKILLIMLGIRALLFVAEALLYPEYIGSFLASMAAGSLLAMGILFVGYFVGKKGMGFGDIKLFGVIGCYVGPLAVVGILFFSLCFAAGYCVVLLLLKKIGAKDEIPFAPFAFIGMIIASLLGM